VAKLEAQAENARLQRERAEALFERKAIAQADLDTARATQRAAEGDLLAARGNMAQAKASLNQAQVNLDYTTIVSPTTGVVISRSVDVGQTVAASLQAPTLFLIAEDLTKMQVDTSVAEADIGKLKPDMDATFTVDAYPDQKFSGVIRQIRDAPQTLQNVVTYDAVIDVDNADLRLKPGMTANVTFVYAERKDVLRIPSAALRFRPPDALLAERGPDGAPASKEKGKGKGKGKKGKDNPAAPPDVGEERSVWKLNGEGLAKIAVDVGVSDGTKVEIKSGQLAEGDIIVVDAVDKSERAQAKGKNKGLF